MKKAVSVPAQHFIRNYAKGQLHSDQYLVKSSSVLSNISRSYSRSSYKWWSSTTASQFSLKAADDNGTTNPSVPPPPHDAGTTPTSNNNNTESLDFSDVPGVKTGGDKYVIMFTCKKCDTRSAKKISKNSYHHGVVVVRCACCQNLHLIADHIGVFEERGWDIQKFIDAANDGSRPVKVVNDDNVLELSPDEILGRNQASERLPESLNVMGGSNVNSDPKPAI